MISALAWVPKGASRRLPERLKLTDEEMNMLRDVAIEEEAAAAAAAEKEEEMPLEATMASDEDVAGSEAVGHDGNGLPLSFNMDQYDDEDDDAAIKNYIGTGAGAMDETEEEDGDDEQMQEHAQAPAKDQHDEDDDDDDVEIRPSDSVILVANTEEECSTLEVQVYDDTTGALYVHHEINLPAFPLCLAWMDCAPVPLDPRTGPVEGSFVAVGTFKPGIEIWDLDVLDVLEPMATLGGDDDHELRNVALPTLAKRRKNPHATTLKPSSHQDAVMALDWNTSHRNMLASGSADTTVKVWDITTQKCLYTMTHHTNKVQSVRWNPAETTVLATASFDRTLVVLDGRNPEAFSKFQLTAEVESIAWIPSEPSTIVAAAEDGTVVAFDVRRNGSEPLFRFNAHDSAVSAISFSPHVPGFFATAGVDKTVKLWDLKDTTTPCCVTSKNMNVGELFTLSFYQDAPFLLGVGGSKGILALWDTSENDDVESRFRSRVQDVAISASVDLSSSFRSPDQLGEELAIVEEREQLVSTRHKTRTKRKSKKR
ncbi:hypothetical protein PsorP6_007946 [Peronosclerospora sorghi]|uniref:Uncharacterized protein n=1 Tax=Peronosclerospora sorghi TaxID=230839 RepID=A0ACC0W8F2_9STRA|nr:hypothetical protein PsorP6_007946 [Peronosclerospora sorghi]